MKVNIFTSSPVRIFQIFIFAAGILVASVANAGTPESGEEFRGGSAVEYPDRGVAFVLPATATGFASKASPDHEMLVSIEPFTQYSTLYIQVGTAKFETIAAEMGRMVEFNGNELIPTGKATVQKDGVTYNDFKIKYEDELRAFILALVGKNGTALMLIAIAPEKAMPTYKKAMSDITKTVSMSVGAGSSAQAKHSMQTQRPSRAKKHPTGNLAREVVGVWMHRSNHSYSGMYVESHTNWAFGADGTLAYGSGAALAGDASVAIHNGGDNPPDYGHWRSKDNKLFFTWNDGTKGTATFSRFNYDGSPYLALTFPNGNVVRYKKAD